MNELSLREQQLTILNILKFFNNICIKYNIKYTLCGGTLIGAIRHKGFIPWDDDIDIYIERDEYEKFKKIWKKEQKDYYILTDTEDPNCISAGYVPKIYDNRTLLSNTHCGQEYGLYIDIFVLDSIPDDLNKISRTLKIYRKNLFRYNRTKSKYIKHKSLFNKFLSIILFKILMSILYYIRKAYHNKTNTLVPIYDIPVELKKCIIPKNYFSNFTLKEFEGEMFPVIACYNELLTNYYGDYMSLPPEKDRKPLHINKAYKK